MKRIISLIIFATIQLGCFAQESPKLESLYAYLKAKGLVKSYTLSNQHEEGLRKVYSVDLGLFEDRQQGRNEAKMDSAIRAEQRNQREAVKQIRRTLSELTEDAAESYSYEYHQGGKDTIITTIALNSYTDGPIPTVFKDMGIVHMDGFKMPALVHFRYVRHKSPESFGYDTGIAKFKVNAIVDSTLRATQDFNVKMLHKTILPLLKDKTIKRRTIHCQHDSTFDVFHPNNIPFYGELRCQKTIRARGDNNLTVYKFTSEDKAKAVLHQIMECARQHIAEHPREAYTICSDEYFPPLTFETMFKGGTYEYEYNLERPRTSMTIDTMMDEEGFYILINVYEDDEVVPGEWKTLKEVINGKKVYYKDKL
jgi:hypothetical protein